VYERVFEPKRECSYPIKKALRNDSFATCYEVVNDLLFNIFKYYPDYAGSTLCRKK
jgi:hypothetical protein